MLAVPGDTFGWNSSFISIYIKSIFLGFLTLAMMAEIWRDKESKKNL